MGDGAALGAFGTDDDCVGGAGEAGAGSGVTGGVLHAAASMMSAIAQARGSGAWIFFRGSRMMRRVYRRTFVDLFLLLLEAGVALALLIGIVWWTWPRKRKADGTRTRE